MPPSSRPYTGRFAPSPTGPLHFGSLVAAVGSLLQARARGGRWLVRIEDLDPPRTVPGAASDILRTLERLGFTWDGPVLYQSRRNDIYREVLQRLLAAGVAYRCSCSRKAVAAAATAFKGAGPIYPGTCRLGVRDPERPTAVRIRTDMRPVRFRDGLQGEQRQVLERDVGDFVVLRRDGLFAYQLAVVVDDHMQGITEVVRGCDLLESTPRQLYLQGLLGYSSPSYVHLPIAVTADGVKLSKQTGAAPVSTASPGEALYRALSFLRQEPPPELRQAETEPIWAWAVQNWRLTPLSGACQWLYPGDAAGFRT